MPSDTLVRMAVQTRFRASLGMSKLENSSQPGASKLLGATSDVDAAGSFESKLKTASCWLMSLTTRLTKPFSAEYFSSP